MAAGLPGTVRLLFQHAEELMPGGALDVLAEGWFDGVSSAFALHCDPALEVGRVGVRSGAITAGGRRPDGAACTGPGGHTSRRTTPSTRARAGRRRHRAARRAVAAGRPAGRAVPGVGARLGRHRPNAIPREGLLHGTLRVLEKDAWHGAPDMVHRLVDGLVAPYGARAHVEYARGVPPVVNDPSAAALMAAAVRTALGTGAAGAHRAVARRRGLRLVPGEGPGRAGPARRQGAGAAATPTTCTRARSTSTRTRWPPASG
jgi:amidohydrolase